MKLNITRADGVNDRLLLKKITSRNQGVNAQVTAAVSQIIEQVMTRGDEAVAEYTLRFDGSLPEQTEISREALEQAKNAADPAFLQALEHSAENIRTFHARQLHQSFVDARPDGVLLGQRVRGLARVGVYVPGGTAAYPSSVLMNIIPAKIAGVGEIIMCTPPGKDGQPNPDILAAAAVAGADRVFLMGGAQAVAALAYGTQTVPRVDKIVGPGNIYVATAKRLLFGQVDIDMIAGPSEILVLADETANPAYLAADLMSQAEHDPMASAMLVTCSMAVAQQTLAELEKQLQTLSRREIIQKSLENYGMLLVTTDMDAAVCLANELAPEHLEVMASDPMRYLGRLDNAGSVFLGPYTPEPVGDYYAGPNHVLPTSGTARFFSPLSVESFQKRSGFVCYTKQALLQAQADIVSIAGKEGLTAHAHAVSVRFEN